MASYYKGSNNKWSVRFRTIENGVAVNKRLSGFNTKKEAANAHVVYMAEHQPEKIVAKSLTVQELIALYLEHKKHQLKESTIMDMNKVFSSFVLPYFGNKQLAKITKYELLAWQNSLSEKNFSYQYKKKIRGYFSSAWTFGMKYLDAPSNLFLTIEGFRQTGIKKEMKYYTEEEFKAFISAVDDLTYKTFFTFLYLTGCRRGEALALLVEDVDFDAKTVRISKSVSRVHNDPEKLFNVTSPKNIYSNRTIDLPNNLLKLLDEYIKTEKLKKSDYLFKGSGPISETTLQRKMKDYSSAAGVKNIRLHDFRHSHASFLISKGVSIVAIAKRLGHSDIEQTLNTYAHLMPTENEVIVNLLDKI